MVGEKKWGKGGKDDITLIQITIIRFYSYKYMYIGIYDYYIYVCMCGVICCVIKKNYLLILCTRVRTGTKSDTLTDFFFDWVCVLIFIMHVTFIVVTAIT